MCNKNENELDARFHVKVYGSFSLYSNKNDIICYGSRAFYSLSSTLFVTLFSYADHCLVIGPVKTIGQLAAVELPYACMADQSLIYECVS